MIILIPILSLVKREICRICLDLTQKIFSSARSADDLYQKLKSQHPQPLQDAEKDLYQNYEAHDSQKLMRLAHLSVAVFNLSAVPCLKPQVAVLRQLADQFFLQLGHKVGVRLLCLPEIPPRQPHFFLLSVP